MAGVTSALRSTAQEAKKHGLQNVQLILGTDRDPKLARASFDVVFLATQASTQWSKMPVLETRVRTERVAPQIRVELRFTTHHFAVRLWEDDCVRWL